MEVDFPSISGFPLKRRLVDPVTSYSVILPASQPVLYGLAAAAGTAFIMYLVLTKGA